MGAKKSLAEEQRAVKEVLIRMFGILLCSGMKGEEVRACAIACIAAAKFDMQQLPRIEIDSDAQDFGSILRTWHRQSQFLTSDGFPRPLPFEGKFGLRSLVGRHFPKSQVESVFARLRAAGFIKKNSVNKWIPTQRHAVFPNLDSELLQHLAEGVSRLVETVIGNVTAEQKENTLFERSAKVRKFPASAAGEFREFVKTQAIAFLGAMDDWMEARAEAAKGTNKKKCTAGVFTFAFMDPIHSRRVNDIRKA